ncbi:MAG: hypothetical protein K2K64_00035 [Muribaculaceae bacterium]|nr:hypothetical protein [Muribaculaceae bacterium]
MNGLYSETYFLSAAETNAEQEISLPLLTAKLIDIATAHANSLGIGNPSLGDIKAGWVLSRITIEMDQYPKVNEDYTISTWIETFNRHFSQRAFKISSPDGRVFGYARSVWMIMDTVTHTNVGLSHCNLPEDAILGTVPPIEKQTRHVPITLPGESSNTKGALSATHPVFEYKFKYCDLDFYRHVNTVRYVTLLMNRFSLREHDETFVRRLEISFLHEARYDMLTQLLRSDDEDSDLSSFLLRKADDKEPLLFARVVRAKRVN